VVLASVQSQDAHARAVIDRRVLEPFAPPAHHHLHVDLNGIARAFLLKQLQLLRAAAPSLDQVRHADIAEDPLNRLRRHPDLVHARQPDLRTVRAEPVLESRLRDQRDDALANPPSAPRGILRYQALKAGALPVAPPLPHRHSG